MYLHDMRRHHSEYDFMGVEVRIFIYIKCFVGI